MIVLRLVATLGTLTSLPLRITCYQFPSKRLCSPSVLSRSITVTRRDPSIVSLLDSSSLRQTSCILTEAKDAATSRLYSMGGNVQQSQGNSAKDVQTPVYMKVYDLSHGLVANISLPLLGFQLEGIWHTSIAIFGNEYLFGSGISYSTEEICERNTSAKFVKKVLLGHTNITQEVFHDYIESIREQFSPESYQLLKWNCNNFTDVVAEFLTGKGIPDDYTGLVNKISQSPNGKLLLNMVDKAREQDPNAFVVPGQRPSPI